MKSYGSVPVETIRAAYRQDGVVFLKGALSPAETERVRGAEAELRRRHEEQGSEIRDARFYTGRWPSNLDDVHRWPTVVSLVQELIGEDVALYLRRFLMKDRIFSGPIAPHQELPYYHGGSMRRFGTCVP